MGYLFPKSLNKKQCVYTDTTCSPFGLDEIHDPGIFPEQSNRTRQSDPAMNPQHKKARRLVPVSSVRARGMSEENTLG